MLSTSSFPLFGALSFDDFPEHRVTSRSALKGLEMDVKETDTSFEALVNVPGVEKEDIDKIFSPLNPKEIQMFRGEKMDHCYVDFDSEDCLVEALKYDQALLNGSPVRISAAEASEYARKSEKENPWIGVPKSPPFRTFVRILIIRLLSNRGIITPFC